MVFMNNVGTHRRGQGTRKEQGKKGSIYIYKNTPLIYYTPYFHGVRVPDFRRHGRLRYWA
jgi:hypothetical protein